MEEKKFITAKEAKALSETPARLLNVIFRNIKETAEMGENIYVYTSHLSPITQKFVTDALVNKGFTVRDAVTVDNWVLAPETEETVEVFTSVRVVALEITW